MEQPDSSDARQPEEECSFEQGSGSAGKPSPRGFVFRGRRLLDKGQLESYRRNRHDVQHLQQGGEHSIFRLRHRAVGDVMESHIKAPPAVVAMTIQPLWRKKASLLM
ncbi:MAG: hypothetical protein IPK15_05400 [Verrucomicrobia bacterium]|nr:hypothetical protein [Verrucomicrobiota bacterium]